MNLYKVAHLTSAHPRYDARIFLKECTSLAKNGYSVSLVVADGQGDEQKNGISIYDVGSSIGRFDRMRHAPARVLAKARLLNADVYHLHDPELIPIGLKLKKAGKKVVFDAHEDVPKQILGKPYLNKATKLMISNAFAIYEHWACLKLDAVIAATPFIREKFTRLGVRTVDINNFPLLGELSSGAPDWNEKYSEVCYLGGLGRIRGILEIVQSMELTKSTARLQLGGEFSEFDFERQVRGQPGWQRVDELGWLDRAGVKATLDRSKAGLVTLHPVINYLDALPVKMFEYMAAGIPVIASHFPMWREIVELHDCGLCVDPLDPAAIAKAIDFFITHPEEARRMGGNGQRAVQNVYNWRIEEAKLLAFYCSL